LGHAELDIAVQQLVADPIYHAEYVGRESDLEPKRLQLQYGVYWRWLAVIISQRHESFRHLLHEIKMVWGYNSYVFASLSLLY
jgi:hypothetical protein